LLLLWLLGLLLLMLLLAMGKLPLGGACEATAAETRGVAPFD